MGQDNARKDRLDKSGEWRRPSTGQLNDLDQACHNVSDDMATGVNSISHSVEAAACAPNKSVILETSK
jgi:hypothetical protein